MTSRALEAKHERILKELVRRPENKRCADCDTTVRAWMQSYGHMHVSTFTPRTGSIICRDQLQYVCVHRLWRCPVRAVMQGFVFAADLCDAMGRPIPYTVVSLDTESRASRWPRSSQMRLQRCKQAATRCVGVCRM